MLPLQQLRGTLRSSNPKPLHSPTQASNDGLNGQGKSAVWLTEKVRLGLPPQCRNWGTGPSLWWQTVPCSHCFPVTTNKQTNKQTNKTTLWGKNIAPLFFCNILVKPHNILIIFGTDTLVNLQKTATKLTTFPDGCSRLPCETKQSQFVHNSSSVSFKSHDTYISDKHNIATAQSVCFWLWDTQ